MSVAQMEAGRELDALVAIHLFGWRWYAQRGWGNAPSEPERAGLWPPSNDEWQRWNMLGDARLLGVDHGDVPRFSDWHRLGSPAAKGLPHFLERYSTTWEGAGLVVEAMRGKGFAMALDMEVGPEGEALYGVTFWNGAAAFDDDHIGNVALAICRAALAAMEAQQDGQTIQQNVGKQDAAQREEGP